MLGGLLSDQFVVDGELVIEIDGRLSFDALQMRLHPAESRVQKLSRQTPARFILFDILLIPGGDTVIDQPLSVRRRHLEEFIRTAVRPNLAISPFTRDRDVAEGWLRKDRQSTDGVVAKRLDGIYEPGERAMIKVNVFAQPTASSAGFGMETGAARSDRCCSGFTTKRENSIT